MHVRMWIVGALAIAAGCGKGKKDQPAESPPSMEHLVLADADGGHIEASFDLVGTDGAKRAVTGSLNLDVFEDSKDVCSIKVHLVELNYDAAKHAKLAFTWDPPCPAPTRERRVRVVVAPDSGAETNAVYVAPPPSLASAPEAPPAPAPAPVDAAPAAPPLPDGDVAIDPLPVVLHAPGATMKPDAEDPTIIVVTTKGCAVNVSSPDGSMRMDGGMIKAVLESAGAKFTKSELAEDHWHLEYTVPKSKTPRGVNTGVLTPDAMYVCNGDFADAKSQACAAALCATMRPR